MKHKRIASQEVYDKYCQIHEELGLEDEVKYRDELDLLEILISEFDDRERKYAKKLNPVELLESIMKDENITKSELARELSTTRQLISDILRYRRNISKNMVTKLSTRFAMRPEAFSRPYKLKIAKKNLQTQATN
jgi:HTH-type transcriptional regulator/antitoxin HigA